MKASDNLHLLIKTLTKPEKRYFKLFSSIYSGDKFYLYLFDEISKQEKYDEEKILSRLGKKKDTSWFSIAKSRLYNLILKSMENRHTTKFSEVKNCLHRVNFLYDKGLYEQCGRELHKARKIASEYEMHTSMLEIGHWDTRLAMQKKDSKDIDTINKERIRQLNFLRNTESFRQLDSEIYNKVRLYGIARNKKDMAAIEKMIKHPLLNQESNAKTFEAKLMYYDCYVYYWWMKGDYEKAYGFSRKSIYLFASNYKKDNQFVTRYIGRLHNLLLIAANIKRNDDAHDYIKIIRQQQNYLAGHRAMTDRVFYLAASSTFIYTNHTGNYEENTPEIKKIETELRKYESKLEAQHKLVCFNNLATHYFAIKDYKKSIYWLNKIRDERSLSDIQIDIQCFIKLFYLIVHYEAGHLDLIPYLLRSTHWFLQKSGSLYKFETLLLEFFRNKLPKVNTKKEIIIVFQDLKNNTLPLLQDEYEKNVFIHFDFVSWIDSKIENRPFAEVVRLRHSPKERIRS